MTGRSSPGPMPSLLSGFASYLRHELMLQESTCARYERILDDFTMFLAGEPRDVGSASAITTARIAEFLRARAGRGPRPSRSAWNNCLAAVRTFCRWLERYHDLGANPAMKIERQTVRPRRRIPLSVDEYLAVLGAIRRGPRFYRARNVAMAEILFQCGLRVSSVVGLDVHQVDLRHYLLHDVRVKGGKHVSIPFNDRVGGALAEWLLRRGCFHAKSVEPALFLSDRGRRISGRAIQDMVATYARRAQIARPVSPHVMRHSSATELAKIASMSIVQEHCGHESIATTQRYVHTEYDAWRQAVHALGQAVTDRARALLAEAGVDSGDA